MAKVKYFYDPTTLAYRKIERNWRHRLRGIGLFLLSSAAFAFVFYVAADNIVDTKKKKRLNSNTKKRKKKLIFNVFIIKHLYN